MATATKINGNVVDEEKGHINTNIEETLDEARTKVVEAKTCCDKVTFVLEMFQVLLLVVAMVFGWWCCSLMLGAASSAHDWQPRPSDFNNTRSCAHGDDVCFGEMARNYKECRDWHHQEQPNNYDGSCEYIHDYSIHPRGGDMIGRTGGGCQVHFRVGEALGLAKPVNVTVAEVKVDSGMRSSGTVAKVGIGAKVGAKVNEVLFGAFGDKKGDVTIACPIDLGEEADCSIVDNDWGVLKEQGEDFDSSGDFYVYVAWGLPIWFIVKVLSLDGELIDMTIRKLTCGMVRDNTGRLDDLMIDFDCMQRCPMLQSIFKYVVKYLRFKLAANALLWPLTTIGFNSKCGGHVYTKMPHYVVWQIAVWTVCLDGAYLLVYYFAVSCCKEIKTYRIFYLPFLASTAMSVLLQMFVLAFTGSALFIFGWNFSLAFDFSMSVSFNVFRVMFSVLSVVEQVSLFVTIGKALRKQNVEKKTAQETHVCDAREAAVKI